MKISVLLKAAMFVASTSLILSACQGTQPALAPATTTTSASTTVPSQAKTVTIQNMAFTPPDLHMKVGETVTWTNKDTNAHTVTSDQGSFESGSLRNGASFSFTFTSAGTFTYHCAIHPSMTASVIVSQ